MSVLITVFISLQLLLVSLDVYEHRRQRSASEQSPIRRGTLCFLLLVTALFLSIQLAGNWCARPMQIMDWVQDRASVWSGHGGPPPLSRHGAVLLSVPLFYAAGFWDYVVHRYFSHSRWFWMTHEYHHLPCQVSVVMPGIFARPFGFIPVAISTLATAATIHVALYACGLPQWNLRPLLPTLLMIGLLLTSSHSSFLRRWPFVHRALSCVFFTSPQEHLLHHGIDSHGNYGNFTTLWDRVFGTYMDPVKTDLQALPLGLAYDQDFVGTLTLGRIRLSHKQRQKFQIAQFCNVEPPKNP